MDLSVIICCYNSASKIIPTLEHLAKQAINGLICELILVDNNCTDNTIEIAYCTWNELGNPFHFHVVHEPQSGLSNARKAGVLKSKGDIVIFCDDDNWLDKNYLLIAYSIFKSFNKLVGACGESIAVSNVELPMWFEKYQSIYACGNLPIVSGSNNDLITLRGAGMVIRGEIIRNLYLFGIKHTLSGRKGKELSSGEDDEISFWLKILGGELKYFNKLKLQHFIDSKRLTTDYREKLLVGITESREIFKELREVFYHANRKKNILDLKFLFVNSAKGRGVRIGLFPFFINSNISFNVKILKKSKILLSNINDGRK